MDNTKPKPTRLMCDPSGIWFVQQMMELTFEQYSTFEWIVVYQCKEHDEAGYHEAKKWMEDNL